MRAHAQGKDVMGWDIHHMDTGLKMVVQSLMRSRQKGLGNCIGVIYRGLP